MNTIISLGKNLKFLRSRVTKQTTLENVETFLFRISWCLLYFCVGCWLLRCIANGDVFGIFVFACKHCKRANKWHKIYSVAITTKTSNEVFWGGKEKKNFILCVFVSHFRHRNVRWATPNQTTPIIIFRKWLLWLLPSLITI